VAESNIRRQIRRLRELYLIEKVKTKYRLTEKSSLAEIFDEKVQNFVLSSIVARVKEYIAEVDKRFEL
jgi:predicted transcriptional regulator